MNFNITSELRKNKYDAIIVHGWHYFTYWLAFLAAPKRTRIFLHSEPPLNQELLKPKWKSWFKKMVMGILFRKVSRFLAIGTQNKAFYKYYGAKDEKIFLTPYAVDNGRLAKNYKKLKSKKEEIKKELSIPSEKTVILFNGKLIEKKRPIDLLKAYEKVKTDKKTLIFVGDGKLRNSLENYTNKRGLRKVYFVGFKNQTELPKYYAMADILVLPSGVGETWGVVVNEAMCFNLPIVVSDLVGCGKDLVIHGKNGFIFKTGDVEELANYLEKLINDSNLRKEMGDESFEIIKNWDYQADIKAILKALEVL